MTFTASWGWYLSRTIIGEWVFKLELQNFLGGYKNVLPVIPVGGQDHMVLYVQCVFKMGHLSIGKHFCEVSGKYFCQFSVLNSRYIIGWVIRWSICTSCCNFRIMHAVIMTWWTFVQSLSICSLHCYVTLLRNDNMCWLICLYQLGYTTEHVSFVGNCLIYRNV